MNTHKRTLSPLISQQEAVLKKQRINGQDLKLPLNDKSAEKKTDENYDFLFDDESDFDMDVLDAAVQGVGIKVENLDLSVWQRCVVEKSERDPKSFDLILKLIAADTQKDNKEIIAKTICHLQGPWCHTRVEVGDLVYVLGMWDKQLEAYVVNNESGFCVTNPDTLISGTTVVGSLFCRRKSVLQDRFKGIDANNKIMVIGSLVHELLQMVLAKQIQNYQEIQEVSKQLLESPATAHTLYASLMTREETVQELQKFVPKIYNFVKQYIGGKEAAPVGCITQIQDIEENLWVPQLGLKGKVDVSVRVRRRRDHSLNFPSTNENALPLELKTGRASFSMEHKGQVILYQMMLSAIGKETHSGFLLYLREGILREIKGARNEQRDLIVLRNDLSHYLSHLPAAGEQTAPLTTGDGKFIQPFELPEPISHHSACGNCAYATICCTFAKTDHMLELRAGHPLIKVMKERTAHLQREDYEYFIRWCRLLSMEEQEAKKSNYLRSLWTDKVEKRVRNGRAIMNLELLNVELEGERHLHMFRNQLQEPTEHEPLDLSLCGFSLGEYVIVSSAKRLAIASGCVYDITKSTISISLERNLKKNYSGECFIVDKHESQSGNVFNYTNLGLLLDSSERASALRSIIVRREPPTFSKLLPKQVCTAGSDILKPLNSVQREAVLQALATESFMLIKGLPGTGKTQTLVAIVRLLHMLGKSVLITSHTHSAVDNLMIRLKTHSMRMLRLGSGARINSQLREYGECVLTADCRTEADYARIYAAYNIVGVTCLGSAHSIFLHRKFDFCIVDEATQVMQCTVLRPLFFCEKFILVGDPDQLPPPIRSKEARQHGADESLFLLLDSPIATKVLTLQYRMNKTITKLANNLTYAGKLQCASKDVEAAVIQLSATVTAVVEKWLERALHTHIDQAVFMLDTGDSSERSYNFASTKHSSTCAAIELTFADDPPLAQTQTDAVGSTAKRKTKESRLSKYTNYCEAAIIFHIVRQLLVAGFNPDRIGIIAPYRAQVELLRKLTEQHAEFYKSQTAPLHFDKIEVNTVDQYQGRDKDVIIYSCAKTGAAVEREIERSRDAEILEDKRRLTVAITRSKHKLILVGDSASLQQYTPFSALLARIPSQCKLKLEDGKLDFSWQLLFENLSQVIGA